MKRNVMTSLGLLALCSSASAQLKISVPSEPVCPQGAVPITGIAIDTVMNGSYGSTFPDELQRLLEQRGFSVHPDYSYQLMDKASIGIKGEVNRWENYQGQQSSRLGEVHLTVYDLASGKTLLRLDQDPARVVFSAPRPEDFTKSVADALAARFCPVTAAGAGSE